MTDTNPYQAPTDVQEKQPLRGAYESVGMEFESDWSAEGLRRRRKSAGQRLGDFAFGFLTVIWLASLVSAARSPYGGLFCLLTPVWILSGVVWFSNVAYRNGGNFSDRYAGLAGPVTGRVDGGWVRIDGPALRIAARVRDCYQCSLLSKRAYIQPPGIETSLPIAGADIQRTWRSKPRVVDEEANPVELLGELSSEQEQIIVSGTLRGTDLIGQNCWRFWMYVGLTCATIGLAFLAWAIYLFLNLPPWVIDRPNHYRFSDADVNSIVGPSLCLALACVLIAFGVWHLLKTFRGLGEFAALITPQMVAIANHRVARGYHGSALAHFRWTPNGFVVRNKAQYVMFLIPARWFDDRGLAQVTRWYSSAAPDWQSNIYIGPKV